MSKIVARIEHRPELKLPWQIRVQRENGKWHLLDAKATEERAKEVLDRITRYDEAISG